MTNCAPVMAPCWQCKHPHTVQCTFLQASNQHAAWAELHPAARKQPAQGACTHQPCPLHSHVMQGFEGFLTSKNAMAKNKNKVFKLEDRAFSLSSVTSPAVSCCCHPHFLSTFCLCQVGGPTQRCCLPTRVACKERGLSTLLSLLDLFLCDHWQRSLNMASVGACRRKSCRPSGTRQHRRWLRLGAAARGHSTSRLWGACRRPRAADIRMAW